MILDELKNEVQRDLKLDDTELDSEALKNPLIHGKYIKQLFDGKLVKSKRLSEMKMLRRDLWLFYSGKASDEEYQKYPHFDPNMKILKQDINMWIEADERFQELQLKIDLIDAKIEYINNAIKGVNDRGWAIKNAIEWRRFINGM
jgi:hypothetical protein